MSTSSQGYVVAAYFDKQSDAENAVRELQAAGFASHQIGSSYDDIDNRSLTSDEYSPNSTSSSRATSSGEHTSFWDKVKEFFAGEPDHDDIKDHKASDDYDSSGERRHDAWTSSGIRVPNSYDERLRSGGGLVTVHVQNRSDEAEQILLRNNGEIDRDISDDFGKHQLGGSDRQYAETPNTPYSGSATSDTAAGMGQGTRADITGGVPQQNPEVTARNERENELSSAVNADPNAGWRRDREADPAYQNPNARIAEQEARQGAQGPERRIRFVSDVLRERNQQAAKDSSQRRSVGGSSDLLDDADPNRKIA